MRGAGKDSRNDLATCFHYFYNVPKKRILNEILDLLLELQKWYVVDERFNGMWRNLVY